jgi:hypothetical protein
MKTSIQRGREAILILLFVVAFGLRAAAQWQVGEQVLSPPPRGNYYSMRLGAHGPPLPFLPCNVPVYYLGTILGTTNHAFAYDDRDLSSAGRSGTQMTQDGPPLPGPGNGGGGGGSTNGPPPQGYDYGTNLCLLIGLTNVVSGAITNREVWLVLTNTDSPKLYQIQSRSRMVGVPWEPGEIVQDTGTNHQVSFNNVRADAASQRFFRGAGGDTVVSIALDPDSNLAVEPATVNGTNQMGKFLVCVGTNVSSDLTVIYQVSGSASNGVDYSSLSGTVTITQDTAFAEIEIHPLYDTLPEFDESVTLTLLWTDSYLVEPKKASATMKLYDPRPESMAVAIHDSGWTRWFGLSTTNWNYFVLPESVKEALRSDGTPYAVVSDLDIANGFLLTTNGTPKYPILISLATEAIRDDEITPLADYVATGGFILAGSSSFTRYTNGNPRPNFADIPRI